MRPTALSSRRISFFLGGGEFFPFFFFFSFFVLRGNFFHFAREIYRPRLSLWKHLHSRPMFSVPPRTRHTIIPPKKIHLVSSFSKKKQTKTTSSLPLFFFVGLSSSPMAPFDAISIRRKYLIFAHVPVGRPPHLI